MIAKKSQKFAFLRKNWAYLLIFIAIIAVAFFGSMNKSEYSDDTMNMQSIVSGNSQLSADRVGEFYLVAELADSMNLESSGLTDVNYSSIVQLYQNGQVADDTGKLNKPVTVNIASVSRGVIQYIVKEGETLQTIAARFGLTIDQIRWSNNLSTSDINPGQNLLLPSIAGIAYKIKNGDTVESLAQKYGSSIEAIIAVNDLEKNNELKQDSIIVIPNGVLPETERPEYVVASRPSGLNNVTAASSGYQYTASYASGNRYAYGWCTWYAWQWRHDNMPGNYDLPSNLGNANTWATAAAAAGFKVNRVPQRGDVFQTAYGWAGHVGIVQSVNPDGSIVISDMNGVAGWGRVGTTTVPANQVGQYMYIHGR